MIYRSSTAKASNTKRTLSKESILTRLNEREIYEYYFGSKINLAKAYRSPLRKDKNPSFGFYLNRNGNLIGNDLAGKFSGDCFQFVMSLYNVSFKESLAIINRDFNLKNKPVIAHANSGFSSLETKQTKQIQVKIKDKFSEVELNF